LPPLKALHILPPEQLEIVGKKMLPKINTRVCLPQTKAHV
jgi:hypothetical protein